MSVNGQDVTTIPHQEVAEVIKNSPQVVELGIARLEEIFIDPLTSEEKEYFGKVCNIV